MLLLVALGLTGLKFAEAQEVAHDHCHTSELNRQVFEAHPEAQKEYLEHEKFTRKFVQDIRELRKLNSQRVEDEPDYIIPVVVHVFGTSFGGLSVTQQKIEAAMAELNKEFQGLNPDFNTVDSRYLNIRGTLNIEFRLAQIDPNGNATTGVEFHGTVNGFGNGGGYDNQIQQYAWDNYKYMNVYIQSDLYNDGQTNNSGVAWYPNTYMSDNNLARVVYNGRYILGNTNAEFASTFTHEFGHWLNLIHTHDGGCSGTDNVADTPQDTRSNGGNCSETSDCGGFINYENYMGYNGSQGCYKMFTAGQVNRMLAALQHPARQPLWQNANLISTGVIDGGGSIVPDVPGGLTETNITSNAFSVTWNAANNATSYDVQLWDDVADVWTNQGNVSGTSYTFTGLPANSPQWWRVRSRNADVTSQYSDYRRVDLPEEVLPPSVPVNLSESDLSSTSFRANWASINEATSYTVQRWTGSWTVAGTVTTNSLDLTGLPAESRQYWRVRANNSAGSSAYSGYRTVDLPEEQQATLPQITGLTTHGVYGTGFYAGWSTITQASSYEVQLWRGSWQTVGTSTTYYRWIPKEGNTTTYYFRVRALNGNTSGPWSDYLTVNLPVSGPTVTDPSLIMYPNPATDHFTLQFALLESSPVQITLLDVQGRIVNRILDQQLMSEGSHVIEVDLEGLAPGIYFLRTMLEGQAGVEKLLIR